MIERLRAILAAAGIQPEARELRDALWLASHVRPVAEPAAPRRDRLPEPVPDAPRPERQPGPTEPPRPAPAPPAPGPVGELYAAGAEGAAGELRGVAARSPAVPALRHQLDLARALRPLKRRAPSRTELVVDEHATAAQIAEEGIWLPVLRPAPERWLDLTIVVDSAPSMVVWRRTVAELRSLTERLGAFRGVRTVSVDSSTDPRVPAAMIDPTGRTALLVVTDAVGDAWRDGRMEPLMRRWAAAAPMAVVTVLPQRMWAGTGLRVVPAQLHAATPGLASQDWSHRVRRGRGVTLPIPVVELSAR